MVTSWKDITGIGFVIWLFFTGLFYLVLYMAVLNITDQKTDRPFLKIPVLLALSPPAAFFISIFNYEPTLLFFLMMVSNYFRVRDFKFSDDKKTGKYAGQKKWSYLASYLYIVSVYALAVWMQHPVELDGLTKPYWKSWFTEVPH